MSLAETIRESEQKQRQRYTELLRQQHTAASVQELRDIARALGKSPEEVQRDAEALNSFEAQMGAGSHHAEGLVKEWEAARQSLKDCDAEIEAALKPLQEKRAALLVKCHEIQGQRDASAFAVANARRIAMQNRELLGHLNLPGDPPHLAW